MSRPGQAYAIAPAGGMIRAPYWVHGTEDTGDPLPGLLVVGRSIVAATSVGLAPIVTGNAVRHRPVRRASALAAHA